MRMQVCLVLSPSLEVESDPHLFLFLQLFVSQD